MSSGACKSRFVSNVAEERKLFRYVTMMSTLMDISQSYNGDLTIFFPFPLLTILYFRFKLFALLIWHWLGSLASSSPENAPDDRFIEIKFNASLANPS